MSVLRALERRGLERRANTGQPCGPSTVPPTNGSLGGSAAGVQVNDQSALQLAAVWGSVALISDSIATLPIQQWKMAGGEAVQMDPAPVIERPWSEITQRDFVTQGTLSMLLRGHLWGRVIGRDGNGDPDQVQLVSPRNAKVRRDSDGALEYRFWNQNVPASQVTQAMAMSMPECIVGLNPIEYMRNALGVARAQDLYGNAFYANSARSDGWIGVNDDLEPEQVQEMMTAWKVAHQGINNSHLPAILTGGATFNATTLSMADAQFLEQMQYSASVISGMIYRIPPHMIGMTDKTTSWGAGIEQQELGYVRNTLLIWLSRWEDLMTSWLPKGQFVTFDLSQRLRGDTLQRWSAYQIARVIGAMNSAEIRAAEGMPKVTDPKAAALLEAYDTPFTSSPVKPASSSTVGPGGDKSD